MWVFLRPCGIILIFKNGYVYYMGGIELILEKNWAGIQGVINEYIAMNFVKELLYTEYINSN